MGERAEVKVRVRWWGEIDIKVEVEVGVVEWEDVEKRFRDVGVGTVGGSRVVLGGGEIGRDGTRESKKRSVCCVRIVECGIGFHNVAFPTLLRLSRSLLAGVVTLKRGVNLIPVPWVPKKLGHYVFSKVALRMGGILFEQDEVEGRMEGRTWSEAKNVLADFEVGEGESKVGIQVEGKEIFYGQEETATIRIATNGDHVENAVVKVRGARVIFEDEGGGGFVRGKTEGGEEVRIRRHVAAEDGNDESDDDSLDSLSDEELGEEIKLDLGTLPPGGEVAFAVKVGGEGFKKKRATRTVSATISGSFRSHPDTDTFKFAKVGSKTLTRCRGFVAVDEKMTESSASITFLANVTRRVRVTGYRVVHGGVDVTEAVNAPEAGEEWVGTGEFYTAALFGDFKGGFGGLVGEGAKRGGSRIILEFEGLGEELGKYKQPVPVKLAWRREREEDEATREAKLEGDEVIVNGTVGIHAMGEEGEIYKLDFDKSTWAVEGKVRGKVGSDGKVGVNIIPIKVGRIEDFPMFVFEDEEGFVKGIAKVQGGKVFTSLPGGVYRVELSHSF